MARLNLFFFALILTGLSACQSTGDQSNATAASPEVQTLPGYYGQWLYIKTNGTNVLPDMRRYNWDQTSSKRAFSNALQHVYEYGPSNVAGRIRALVIDHANPNRILIGGASGGVFISENNGSSWKAINDQALSPSVTYMDQNPFQASVIYYCTGEASGNSADLLGAGVFKSIDGGNTFTQLPSTNNSSFALCWSVKCSPKDTNTLFVATHASGLWRSNDAGTTFTRVYNTGSQVNDLELLPDGSVLFTIKGSGVYRSPNGNINTFTKVNSVVSTSSARTELAYCKDFPNVVYAAISGPDNSYNGVLKAFYKSSDGGQTFVAKTNPNGTVNFGFTWYCLTMAVKDNDSNSVFIGSVDIGYSKNGGASWSAANEQHADNHVAIFKGNNMYLGSDGGLCIYNWNNLSTFTSLNNGLNITQFYAGDVSPHSIAIMGGTQDNGTKEGRNQSPAFSNIFGGDGAYCFYHPNQSNVKYYATQNGALYRNGVNMSNNLPTSDTKWFIHPYHMNGAKGDILVYPSNRNLYYSNSGGSNYKLLGTIPSGRLFCATSSKDANPSVFSGGSSAFLAIDSAENTTPVVKDLRLKMPVAIRASFINCITLMPGSRDRALLAFSNVSDSGRVYLASDLFGATPVFKNISGNMPKGLPVNWVECDPMNPETVIFAGTDYGLYITEDGGVNWIKDTRLPSTVVSSIKIHKNMKDIYFFTHGRGVFKGQINNSGISSLSEQKREAAFSLYPVPASDLLNLNSADGSAGTYNIYDLKGMRVMQGSVSGINSSINTATLAEGQYILFYETKTGRTARKFSIIR